MGFGGVEMNRAASLETQTGFDLAMFRLALNAIGSLKSNQSLVVEERWVQVHKLYILLGFSFVSKKNSQRPSKFHTWKAQIPSFSEDHRIFENQETERGRYVRLRDRIGESSIWCGLL